MNLNTKPEHHKDAIINEEEIEEEFNDDGNDVSSSQAYKNREAKEEESNLHAEAGGSFPIPEIPELTKKDKTLKEVLELMEGDFAPIIPDIVTEYYMAKNGFETSDIRISRLLALATQKFILDIAQDAYEYSCIRSASSVYNASNPQARAKQLIQGQQFANQQLPGGAGIEDQQPQQHMSSNAGSQQGKIVLTMEDLSSALSEYGINTSRPDFYR